MIIGKEKKPVLEMLLRRWDLLSQFGALERVYAASVEYAKINGIEMPITPDIINTQPIKQIEMIKQLIVEILPEAKFILPAYEPPSELIPEDLMEMYLIHQQISRNKVKETMKQLKTK